MKNAEVVRTLQDYFGENPYVAKVDLYKEVPFVEIKNGQMHFAVEIEFDDDSSPLKVEIVSRNENTVSTFAGRFFIPWHKGVVAWERDARSAFSAVFDTNLETDDFDGFVGSLSQLIVDLLTPRPHEQKLEHGGFFDLSSLEDYQKHAIRNEVFKDMADFMAPRQYTYLQTLERVRKENLSLARFGDGEIKCMLTQSGISFQRHDWRLMRTLRKACVETPDNLLLCFPSMMVENPFWTNYWADNWFKLKGFLRNPNYGDSFVSRPQAFRAEQSELVDAWRSIWDGKRVCFVTGEGSRLSTEHRLFGTASRKTVILSKNANAFDDLPNVLEKIDKLADVDLFLIALGPAGTALAYELAVRGRQALDIGHLNNSYDNAFEGGPIPEKIPWGK